MYEMRRQTRRDNFSKWDETRQWHYTLNTFSADKRPAFAAVLTYGSNKELGWTMERKAFVHACLSMLVRHYVFLL